MSNNMENIKLVVDLLKKHHINYIVISPGGTNIPFVRAVQDDPYFTCFSVVDERSAMYFAIGLYLQTGKAVATSCTSAQATRNYVPGLTEAYYKRVPILAVTMAKHPRFTYQEYMQAPDQTSLPCDCVKKSFMLPFIRDNNDVAHSIRVANQAMLELSRTGYGPVQLCIPWLDFSLGVNTPAVRSIEHYDIEGGWKVNIGNKRIMIVIGEHRPFSDSQIQSIEQFCECYNTVVYVNHLSNYHGKYSVGGNLTLATMKVEDFAETYCPDILITLGGQTGDYPLYKMLSKTELSCVEHWRISRDGEVVDTYDKLTKVFQCSEEMFFNNFRGRPCDNHEYFKAWKEITDKKSTDINVPFSNAFIAQRLHNKMPSDSVVQFSILNSLRIWDFYELNPNISCYSNVGAFGIDGGLSTMIGQSVITEKLCFMIIGDLAFFYDMNSIGIRHIKNNLRIVLVNNNGGIEFKLDGKDVKGKDRFIAAGNHFKNAEGWAKTCGFIYLSAKSKEEFIQVEQALVGQSDSPILLEAFVSDVDEAKAYQEIISKNTEHTLGQVMTDSLKSTAKNLLGRKCVNKIKSIVK